MNSLTSHLVTLITGILTGWYLTSTFYSSKIDGIYATAQTAQIEAIERNTKLENNLYENVINAQSELASSLNEVDNEYSHAIEFFDNGFVPDRVFLETATSNNSLPKSASVATGNTEQCAVRQTKCDCTNTAEFRNLYKSQQRVSRDCDIDRHYLKTVVKLYESVRNGY